MNAHALLNYLLMLKKNGQDLSRISVNFRIDYDSDVIPVNFAEEDLYDAETNSILESICLLNNINQ